jgi:hypothetical protein
MRFHLPAVAFAIAAMGSPVLAQTVFTTNTTISDTNFSFDGQDIIIRGCTVTINGAHNFNSIIIEKNGTVAGVLTHGQGFTNGSVEGVHLTVSNNFQINADCSINIAGRGHPAATGPAAGLNAIHASGAGHGGAGRNSDIGSLGADCTGSMLNPVGFGSGGGNDTDIGTPTGGAGGGSIIMTVGGACTINGTINAAGVNHVANEGGAGAGGSIRINAGSIAGTGSISVKGGGASYGGSGGGGRIALISSISTFAGTINASGGSNFFGRAGAGTAYTKVGASRGTVVIDNDGTTGEGTEFTGVQNYDVNLAIRNGGLLSHKHGDANVAIRFLGDVTVEEEGFISLNGRGYAAGTGPTPGTAGIFGGGAGHGGAGGDAGNGVAGGDCIDSVLNPTGMGSGGGNDTDNPNTTGGAGGGALIFTVGGTFTVDGRVEANGQAHLSNEAGAGAGGTLNLRCTTFAGDGTVQAAGANAGYGGGGGGGRVVIQYTSSTFAGTLDARGGTSFYNTAGAGTIALCPQSQLATIIVDNADHAGGGTEFAGSQNFDANLIVRNAGLVTHKHGDGGVDLSFSGNVTIEADGFIGADTRGYAAGQGPAAGTSAAWGGGAGHGGAGGNAGDATAGGDCIGSVSLPSLMGSGGGNDTNQANDTGGAGGGRIKLDVGGTLTVDGSLTANGQGYIANEGGSGAGGSLLITTTQLAGSGTIGARGANAGYGGAGGGGRVAIYYTGSSFTGSFDARSGVNFFSGAGAGTVYLKPAAELPTLIIDNFSQTASDATEFSGTMPFEGNIIVRRNALLSHKHGDEAGLTIDVLGDVTVDATGVIGAVGRGYIAGEGPGAGSMGTWAGGGGHGGRGGNSGNGSQGGEPYGLASYPDEFGSGGGNDSNNAGTTGGTGGGKVKLIVGGTLMVNGEVNVNGTSHTAVEAGAGAGGSVYVQATRVEGTGFIRANGGNGGYGGGGGGGRVAIYSCTQLVSPANITAAAGTNFFGSAQVGTVELGSSTITIFLQPDSTTYTGGQEVSLVVDAIGDGDLTYQWRREGVPITDDGRFFGTGTNQLTISPIDCADGGTYDCIVSDTCGSFPTVPAEITVLAPSDYDGSGFVDTDDYTAFVLDFELGLDAADFDGTGFVDTDDFTAFVLAFEAGC